MKFTNLYETYRAFRKPTFTLKVNNTQLDVGEGAAVRCMECRLTTLREAGSLSLSAELEPQSDLGDTWLNAIQLGAVCTLSLGYINTEKTVFSGFVYEVTWDDPSCSGVQGIEITCLDARGQLMLSSCADAGSARTLSQLISALLQQTCCTRMTSATIEAVPQDWDLPFQRTGSTDFDILCRIADFLCYEFYSFADSTYFGPARPSPDTSVIFDGKNGLLSLRRRRSLAGQCAAVAVSGSDDNGERLYAREARESDSGFGMGQAGSALTMDLHQAEPAVRTMAQATYLAKARMQDRQHRSGMLLGRCTGLPELRPGRFLEVAGLGEQVNGSYYVQTVIHTIDETGFETYFEAEG